MGYTQWFADIGSYSSLLLYGHARNTQQFTDIGTRNTQEFHVGLGFYVTY